MVFSKVARNSLSVEHFRLQRELLWLMRLLSFLNKLWSLNSSCLAYEKSTNFKVDNHLYLEYWWLQIAHPSYTDLDTKQRVVTELRSALGCSNIAISEVQYTVYLTFTAFFFFFFFIDSLLACDSSKTVHPSFHSITKYYIFKENVFRKWVQLLSFSYPSLLNMAVRSSCNLPVRRYRFCLSSPYSFFNSFWDSKVSDMK